MHGLCLFDGRVPIQHEERGCTVSEEARYAPEICFDNWIGGLVLLLGSAEGPKGSINGNKLSSKQPLDRIVTLRFCPVQGLQRATSLIWMGLPQGIASKDCLKSSTTQ